MQRLPEPIQTNPVIAPAVRKGGAMPASYTELPVNTGFSDSGPDTESGSLLEYWGILRRRKGTVTLIAVFGTLIGFVVTIPQTPIFQVRTSLEIVGLNENFLNVKESNPLNEGGTSSDEVDIQTQVKILQSESLIDRVMEKLRGGTLPDAPKAIAWRKLLNLPSPATADPAEDALTYARKHLTVRSVGQTRIVELTVDSPSPETAAAFANTLSNEFIDQNIESRWKTTQRTGEWLSRQLDDIRVRLERSEDRLQAYAREAGLVFTDEKTNVSEERLRQVQEALSAAQTDRIAKESRAEMAKSSPAEALPDILNDLTLRDYQGKITELTRQLAELRVPYTLEHPKVKGIQVQIAAMQTAFEKERSNILQRIDNEYDEAVRREKLLDAEYGAQRAVVTGEGEKAVQYNILKREVESNRQLYDAMLQQLKQSTLASALRASNIRVVDPAKLPKRPYKPDIPVSSSLGLLSGLFVGAALVIMQERANRTIQAPGETPGYLNVPELGIIPADDASALIRVRFSNGNPRDGAPDTSKSMLPAIRRSVEMVTWQRKASMVAEAFRATLVSIMFSAEKEERPKILVITSASPSEGKSTIVSNLGVAIAEVNQRTLLIDADLRKPRLHDIFKLKNQRGLSDLLRLKDPSATPIEGFIQETSVPELYVMTSGSTTSAATSLLYSSRLPEVLKELRSKFETIIIDTPPMLQIPDARVLGRMVDRVILVVRAGITTRDAAMAARQRFFEDGTPLLGTMLNYWNPKRSPNGYYGYSDKYYSSYKSYRTQTAGD
jgi:polysaccharide biosynthesis transport protein